MKNTLRLYASDRFRDVVGPVVEPLGFRWRSTLKGFKKKMHSAEYSIYIDISTARHESGIDDGQNAVICPMFSIRFPESAMATASVLTDRIPTTREWPALHFFFLEACESISKQYCYCFNAADVDACMADLVQLGLGDVLQMFDQIHCEKDAIRYFIENPSRSIRISAPVLTAIAIVGTDFSEALQIAELHMGYGGEFPDRSFSKLNIALKQAEETINRGQFV